MMSVANKPSMLSDVTPSVYVKAALITALKSFTEQAPRHRNDLLWQALLNSIQHLLELLVGRA
jgi:hypothetical protein